MRRRGGGDRNLERARNQADTRPYETQDLRPDYERSRVEDEQREEQADVESSRDLEREKRRNKRLDRNRG